MFMSKLKGYLLSIMFGLRIIAMWVSNFFLFCFSLLIFHGCLVQHNPI
ncbi:unnamed protein product [Brassica rapa subsp. narinosa]